MPVREKVAAQPITGVVLKTTGGTDLLTIETRSKSRYDFYVVWDKNGHDKDTRVFSTSDIRAFRDGLTKMLEGE